VWFWWPLAGGGGASPDDLGTGWPAGQVLVVGGVVPADERDIAAADYAPGRAVAVLTSLGRLLADGGSRHPQALLERCPQAGSSPLPKILHRKRPDLVPIFDSQIYRFYFGGAPPYGGYDETPRRLWRPPTARPPREQDLARANRRQLQNGR